MLQFTNCSGECCVCGNSGACLAGHGDDDFYLATKDELIRRLKNEECLDNRKTITDILWKKYKIEYNKPYASIFPKTEKDYLLDLINKYPDGQFCMFCQANNIRINLIQKCYKCGARL